MSLQIVGEDRSRIESTFMTESIHTGRLELVPMTPAFMRASLDGDLREAEQQLGLPLPAGWPGEDADLLSWQLGKLNDDPQLQPWSARAIALRGPDVMIGHI